jgi:hypothetical protein
MANYAIFILVPNIYNPILNIKAVICMCIHCGENDIGDIPCSPSAKSEKASNKVCVIPLVDRIVGFNSLYDVTYISPL